MDENHTDISRKNIIKSTGVFGVIQLFKSVISIIGFKFIAIFLGPSGVGVYGLLTNTLNIIAAITSFGLPTTSVREIAVSDSKKDSYSFQKANYLNHKIAFGVSILGALLSIIFSKKLSIWTFGNQKYQFWFFILSANFFLTNLSTARIAVLKGKRMLKQLAFSNVIIAILTTITSVFIYYFFKFDGIIWVILTSGFINFGVNFVYTKNYHSKSFNLSFSEIIEQSKPILKLGFLLSVNVIFGQICTFLIKLYLNQKGVSSTILGFYEVSTVILVSYLGMVFTAMSVDFYPRLTTIHTNKKQSNELVNNQLQISLLLGTPAIVILYSLAPFLIKLLYSEAFLPVNQILLFGLLAVIIKMITWPLAFIVLAHGDKKQYFKQEFVSDFLNVSLTVLFYRQFGLYGIGVASLLNYIIYGIYVYWIVHTKFGFQFNKITLKIVVVALVLVILSVFSVLYLRDYFELFAFAFLSVIALLFSFLELGIWVRIINYFLKIKNKF
jgi:O-antigen/teichoic acid export membrane protein